MGNILVKCSFLFLFAGFLGACSANDPEIPTEPTVPDGLPIGFGALSHTVTDDSRADGASATDGFVDDAKFKQEGKFLVYSNYDYNLVNGKYTESVPEFQKQMVEYKILSTSEAKWTYEPKRYWSGTGAYHFRACFPVNADIVPSSNGKNLAVNYSIYKDNYDLMVAFHKRDMATYQGNKTEKVNLEFNHALAAVRLKLLASKGKQFTLKRISIKDLYTVGVFSYICDINSDDAQTNWPEALFSNWLPSYLDPSENIYGFTGSAPITDSDATTFKSKFLFAIPQELDPTRERPTKLMFTVEVDGQEVSTVKKLPAKRWLPGRKYTYLIHVEPGGDTEIEVVATDWEKVDAAGDDIIIE